MRVFESGATRDAEAHKPDYEGYLSPRVLVRFGQYMLKHGTQADGQPRTSDNWQKGIPKEQYLKSALRHMVAVWSTHRGIQASESIEEALCGLLFNVQGYLHEWLKEKEEYEKAGFLAMAQKGAAEAASSLPQPLATADTMWLSDKMAKLYA